MRQLMDRYLDRLTLFCFTFLHSVTEAEDMALDAFAVIAMKRSTWYGGSFRRWLYRIARNLSISRFRKLRLVQASFDEAHHLTEPGADAVYWRQEETEALKALLDRLAPDERRVLTLLYLENMSYVQWPRPWAWTKSGLIIWPTAAKKGCGNGSYRREEAVSETLVCVLVALLAFLFGMIAAILVKTIHLEKKEHERNRNI